MDKFYTVKIINVSKNRNVGLSFDYDYETEEAAIEDARRLWDGLDKVHHDYRIEVFADEIIPDDMGGETRDSWENGYVPLLIIDEDGERTEA